MKPLKLLTIFLIPLGVIIALVPINTTKHFKLTPQDLLLEIQSGSQYISPDEVVDRLIKKDPSFQLIDVRSTVDFAKYSLPGAINIPLSELLKEDKTEILNQSEKTNIFYSNSTVEANEAWILTRQLGYQNNYVLQGGLNYWFDVISNSTKPPTTNPNEEFAKYDFRKAAGKALGSGENSVLSSSPGGSSAIPISGAPASKSSSTKKKKGAGGGC